MGAMETLYDYYNRNESLELNPLHQNGAYQNIESPRWFGSDFCMDVISHLLGYYSRTSDWFLVSRPGMVIAIMSFYVYFCVSLGPKLMKNKQAYSLRRSLVVYNFIQVLLSIYLVYEGLMAGWLYEYSYICQPVDYSDNPSALRMIRASHMYFMCKIFELMDTVFFVLRKKDRQITFLHLYHHVSMPLFCWYGVRYIPTGHSTMFGLLNSFVHIIMYTYYMLSAIGPEVQKYLWWRKYLTLLQMLQFTVITAHSTQMLFTNCNFPKSVSFTIVINSVMFLYMFGSYYADTHLKNNASKMNSVHRNKSD